MYHPTYIDMAIFWLVGFAQTHNLSLSRCRRWGRSTDSSVAITPWAGGGLQAQYTSSAASSLICTTECFLKTLNPVSARCYA